VPIDPCHDGSQDNLESDVDCGGGVCSPCSSGFKCMMDTDCASIMCMTDHHCM